jgi:hypothetical protein
MDNNNEIEVPAYHNNRRKLDRNYGIISEDYEVGTILYRCNKYRMKAQIEYSLTTGTIFAEKMKMK